MTATNAGVPDEMTIRVNSDLAVLTNNILNVLASTFNLSVVIQCIEACLTHLIYTIDVAVKFQRLVSYDNLHDFKVLAKQTIEEKVETRHYQGSKGH